MGILSTAAEAAVRQTFEAVLPDRCTVKRGAAAGDGAGGWTEGGTDVATGVPCRVDKDQNIDREALIAGRTIAQGGYIVMLSAVASRWPGGIIDIQASDAIVVTGSGAGIYQPVGSGGPTTDEWIREVRAVRVG